jgi:dihydroflavonol-4-reductase
MRGADLAHDRAASPMTVLVSGAGGFLGSHAVAQLRAAGRHVRAMLRPGSERPWLAQEGVEIVEADLRDERSLRRACRGARALLHCAAHKGLWSRHDREQRRVNVEGTSALLRAAHEQGLERIVHVSTTAAVGATREPEVLDERASWNLHRLGIQYVNSKHEAEERALSAAWAGMPVVVVNPGALFGPRLFGEPASTLARLRGGAQKWVPPGGTSVCDVEDVARGCVAALERGRAGERYILGGHNLSWRELYAGLARGLGVRPPSRRIPRACVRPIALVAAALELVGLARPPWTPEVFRTWGWYTFVDSSKAKEELGYVIRPLEELLARACAGRGV